MNIVKGKIAAPIRAVAYGPEGIGKSTFAGKWPQPLFLDLEEGTKRLEVDRLEPASFSEVEQALVQLAKDHQGYQTLVIDTADWLEKSLTEHICAQHNVAGIEAFGYGKGFTYLEEGAKRFVDQLQRTQKATGMHVLFLAHAQMRKFEQPDEMGSYDRWEMKLGKKTCSIFKEWADIVLFMNYETFVVETEQGKKKAQGGKRVMHTSHHPCWDAKNRFDLPPKLPLEFESIASIFPSRVETQPAAQPIDRNPDLEPVGAKPEPEDPEKTKLLNQLRQLMIDSHIDMPTLATELYARGIMPLEALPPQYNTATLRRVVGNWDKVLNNIQIRKQGEA